MTYILLVVTAVFMTLQNILKQKFNARFSSGVYFFSTVTALFAMVVFLVRNDNWNFSAELLIPSSLFAICYATTTVGTVLAIKHGELTLTSLVVSYSLLIPTFYGILVLDEAISFTLIIGIILLIVSLWLTNKQGKTGEQGFSWKWLFYVCLAFFGNGFCTVVQKWEQIKYGTEGENLFMIIALAIVGVVMLAVSCFSQEHRQIGSILKRSWHLGVLCGLMNGAVNALVIYLNPRVTASVMFPFLSAASLVLIFPYSLLICKQRFTVKQYLGFAVGIVSVILLNI